MLFSVPGWLHQESGLGSNQVYTGAVKAELCHEPCAPSAKPAAAKPEPHAQFISNFCFPPPSCNRQSCMEPVKDSLAVYCSLEGRPYWVPCCVLPPHSNSWITIITCPYGQVSLGLNITTIVDCHRLGSTKVPC